MTKYLLNQCNDCNLVILKWKHYCIDCLRRRRRIYQRRWRRAHPHYVYHYDSEYSKKWYAKQRKLKQVLLDDMIKHPRKYLDRVKI